MSKEEKNEEPGVKKTRAGWVLIIICILILGGAFAINYFTSKEQVPVLRVIVDVKDGQSGPEIDTVEYSSEDIPKTDEPGETESHLPGIYVIALGSKSEEGYFQPYTEWTSKSFKGSGKYKLTAGFNFYPKKGELIKIQVKITDGTGSTTEKKEFVIRWDYEFSMKADCTVEKKDGETVITNTSISKSWEDPSSNIQRESVHQPGIYLIIERGTEQLNHDSSAAYTGEGEYMVTAYFKEFPKIGETLNLKINIKDANGDIINEYPLDGNWTISYI